APPVRAVLGSTYLPHQYPDFGEPEQSLAELAHVRPDCRHRDPDGKLNADPDVSLVELRQEFLTELREHEEGDHEQSRRTGHWDEWPTQAPSDGGRVGRAECAEHRTLTLGWRPTKEQARERRNQRQG